MKRRNLIFVALSAIILSLTSFGYNSEILKNKVEKELYEIRTYEIKLGGDQQILIDYLKNVLQPTLKRFGANHFMLFNELGNSNPTKLWVIISYPNSQIYIDAQNLEADPKYTKAASGYNALSQDDRVYNRFTSSLLLAFDGMPNMLDPINGASLFELRTYEGYSEDAVGRKIKMFNTEEIDLFFKTNLHPLFFGEMIIGPHRPCLTYMLNFKDMEEHDASWKTFVDHPEWKVMSAKKEYANSVSNIRKVFLKPL
tara:strand:+ start:26900 stop:27664 length:765 start_codon:yes stop_codon:yes gene_type:complete